MDVGHQSTSDRCCTFFSFPKALLGLAGVGGPPLRKSNGGLLKALLVVFLPFAFFVTGCGLSEQDSNVEPSGPNKPLSSGDDCEQNAIPYEFLIKRENGEIQLIHGTSLREALRFETQISLQQHKSPIVLAEPNYRIPMPHTEYSQTPDLSSFNNSLNPQEFQWGLEAIQVQAAWDQNYLGQDVIVAVVDSGLDVSHPSFEGQLAVNDGEEANGKDDDNNGYVDDLNGYDFVARSGVVTDRTGHGTHVSGVVGANHNNPALLGVAPGAKILPLNFIDSGDGGPILFAIEAIRYAVDRGAKIINASWGGPFCSLALRDEIASLGEKGVLFVSAAGNNGADIARFPEYPAAYRFDHHISVGASTLSGNTAGFSNFGAPVHLVAPGNHILSTYPPDLSEAPFQETSLSQSLQGTSMAAPFVSATAALLWSAAPNANTQQIVEALLNGTQPGPFPVQTQGHLNAALALEALLKALEPGEPQQPRL